MFIAEDLAARNVSFLLVPYIFAEGFFSNNKFSVEQVSHWSLISPYLLGGSSDPEKLIKALLTSLNSKM